MFTESLLNLFKSLAIGKPGFCKLKKRGKQTMKTNEAKGTIKGDQQGLAEHYRIPSLPLNCAFFFEWSNA